MNSVFNNICMAYFIIIEEKKKIWELYMENFSTQRCFLIIKHIIYTTCAWKQTENQIIIYKDMTFWNQWTEFSSFGPFYISISRNGLHGPQFTERTRQSFLDKATER